MTDIVNMYAAVMLGIIFVMINVSLLIILALTSLDIISQFWYTIKAKRAKYKEMKV